MAKPGWRKGRSRDNPPAEYVFDEYQTMFMDIYCRTHDAPRAAVEAGYRRDYANKLMQNPHIIQAIYERLRNEKMAAPEVINRVGQLVRADLKHYMRIKRTSIEKEVIDEKTGEVTKKKVVHKEVVVDLVRAMENDETYPLKSIEYYRSGEVKKITIEDRLEAIRLMGSAFGLFGNKQAGDDAGRSWMERARDSGYEIKTVIEAMMEIAKEHGMTPPKELIEGSYRETQAGIEIGDLSEEEVDATPR